MGDKLSAKQIAVGRNERPGHFVHAVECDVLHRTVVNRNDIRCLIPLETTDEFADGTVVPIHVNVDFGIFDRAVRE